MEKINITTGYCLGCFLIILIFLSIFGLFGFVFMLLWNWLAPLFWTTAPILTYWESCGIIFLIGFIASFFNHKSN